MDCHQGGAPRKRALVIVGLALGLSLGSVSTSAVVSASAASLPGWVTNPNPDVLTNATITTVQGQVQDGGCAWPVSGSLPVGAAPTETQVVAMQPATCEAVLEDGTVTSQAPTSPSTLSESDPVAAVGAAGGTPLASQSKEAWVKGQYNDALTLQLTAVEDYFVWTDNGSCVTSAGAGAAIGWDSYTGWYVNYNHHTYGAQCSHVWSQNVTTFENDVFPLCEGFSVFTYYDPVWIHGNANGTLAYRAVLWDGPFLCGDYIWPAITKGYGSPPSV